MNRTAYITETLARIRASRDELAAAPLPRPRDVAGSSATGPAEQRARLLARKDASIARLEKELENQA